ncbi:MAG: DnaD domain protein [Bacilli bacterium]
MNYFLETASPNDFVKQKTGTALTGNEIEMFDQLLRDTNISIGVLNVLIGYVLVELNGQIPNYNYFLKIINTWKRAKVVSTLDALDYINNLNTTKKTKTSYRTKTQKSVPSWYQDYKNDLKPKIETNEKAKTTNSDLEELRKFFNPEKED